MRLKPIEPGMAIECKNDEEKKALLEELGKQGYIWIGGKSILETDFFVGNTIHIYAASDICNHKHIIWSDSKWNIEFADLIIPDLTPEEVVEWLCENYYNPGMMTEVFGEDWSFEINTLSASEVVKRIAQHKADHEKKGPETEWVWFAEVHGTNYYSTKNCDTEEEARKGFNENRKAGYKHGYEDGYSKAIDEAIEKFLEYGCVCVEWNRGLSKEKLVDDVLRQVMGQVVITLEKMKGGAE